MSDVHVGMPPKEWESWESRIVHFHGFESLSTKKGLPVISPRFICCNHTWQVLIFPGGHKNSHDGMISVGLGHRPGPGISAIFCLLIRSASGKVFKDFVCKNINFGSNQLQHASVNDFEKYSEIIDASNNVLKNGTLTVEVCIKPSNDHCCLNFYPKNITAEKILQSFMDEETADVIFEVSGQNEEGVQTTVHFYAHSLIMHFCARGTTLASLCEDCDGETPVPIVGVSSRVFRQMLFYVYGGTIDSAEWKDGAMDLIEAADRYGLQALKIEAEAWHVKYLTLTVENAIETLAYAEARNCFLLKETAMSFILENGSALLQSDEFEKIPTSTTIMREMLSLAGTRNLNGDEERNDPSHLSMNELRAKLHDYRETGVEIYGPRKTLIEQLQFIRERLGPL
ncbi:hypothetical protein ACHAWF_018626 [Thalassiosira exigua]